jgi:hypothetical protein
MDGPDVVGDFTIVRMVKARHPLNVVAQLVWKGPGAPLF